MVIFCLALAGPVWAGTIDFAGNDVSGQGTLFLDPGMLGNKLTIGAGGGGLGALIDSLTDTLGLCGTAPPGCIVSGGYMTLTSGGLTGGGCLGGNCLYTFGSGGTIDIFGTVTTSLGTSTGHLFTAMFTGGAFIDAASVGTFNGGLNISSIHLLGPAFSTYNFTGGSGDAITISVGANCGTGGICTGLVDNDSVSLQTQDIPEPATLCVLGSGLFALGTGLKKKLLVA